MSLARQALLHRADTVYTALASRWHGRVTTRWLGSVLIWTYLLALAVVELNRLGLLGTGLGALLPTNHFAAVDLAFTLLLVVEVIGIVFVLADSVANSLAKQFELLALILLRKAFLTFSHFGEPIRFDEVRAALVELTADAVGALLVFVVVGLFYRTQLHRKITRSEDEQVDFIRGKRLVALALLVGFLGLAVADALAWLRGESWPFFEAFYLVLIFSDILIVLISFRYSSSFTVLFRNSGFALSTVGAPRPLGPGLPERYHRPWGGPLRPGRIAGLQLLRSAHPGIRGGDGWGRRGWGRGGRIGGGIENAGRIGANALSPTRGAPPGSAAVVSSGILRGLPVPGAHRPASG